MTKTTYQLRIKNGEVIELQGSLKRIVKYFIASKYDIWEFLDRYDIYMIEYNESILPESNFFIEVIGTRRGQ